MASGVETPFLHLASPPCVQFVSAVMARWPNAVLQFEDFSTNHALKLLERYRNHYMVFNDDIQVGDGAGNRKEECKSGAWSAETPRWAWTAGRQGLGILVPACMLACARDSMYRSFGPYKPIFLAHPPHHPSPPPSGDGCLCTGRHVWRHAGAGEWSWLRSHAGAGEWATLAAPQGGGERRMKGGRGHAGAGE